ncbi:hypothetical protein [Prevotella sp. 10(H)]|uniref:gliding motility lipoprotein GldB n=1 Tax=Prevotella sp. 10(H) TaxID=1158294 RepID=UPI0004A6BB60|nr:hypothetical protein [Prevotella sp. 10(H)]
MKNLFYPIIFAIICFIGCSGTTKKSGDETPQKKITITRFDKDLYSYLQNPDAVKESGLKEKYPLLLPAFGRIAMDNSDPGTFFPTLREYFAHPMLIDIYKESLKTFADITSYEEELGEVNDRIAEKFRGRKLPELAMHVSGFKENVIILNNLISISTDKYLGSDYGAYQEFFQPFERQQMQPQFLVRDYLKAWLMSDIIKADEEDQQNLLSAIIYEGKVLYILSALLPEKKAEDLIGYTTTQYEWSKHNEKSTWQTIVKQNYLYSTDHMVITRFINDGAYTAAISKDSPGRIGSWIGWQIVDLYAKKKGVTLTDLIGTDAQTILKESKYNP